MVDETRRPLPQAPHGLRRGPKQAYSAGNDGRDNGCEGARLQTQIKKWKKNILENITYKMEVTPYKNKTKLS
jgi:hypothetical protein